VSDFLIVPLSADQTEAWSVTAGGSTIVLLFEKGALRWDEDLLNNSRASIETLVKMGTHVGTAVRKSTDPVKQVELLS
jgi:hypothetical protein